MMPSGGGGGVGGGPAEEAACSSGAAPSRAEAKRPQQTLSVLPRPSLGPPSTNSQRLLPDPQKIYFKVQFYKCKIQISFVQCMVRLKLASAETPVSCRTDLALAHLLL